MDLAACDRNLARTTVLTAGGGGRRRAEHPGLALGASGFPVAFFNAAVLTEPTSDPHATLDTVTAFFGDLPFLFWVREGLDEALLDAALGRRLATAGGPPLMVLDEIPTSIPAAPDGLVIERVGPADVPELAIASALGNAMGVHLAEVYLSPEVVDGDDAAVVVGRVDGEAVATALVVVTEGAAGIYAVSTVPKHRGRGYGAAITWAAVAEGARLGATWSLLQSSELGYRVYERMGYRQVGGYRFVSPPGA